MRYVVQILLCLSILITCTLAGMFYHLFYFIWEFRVQTKLTRCEEIVDEFRFKYFYNKQTWDNFVNKTIKKLYL